jgi:methylenetetrahydrofolate dehydrogenase (NADP+)/methenyltetrahydrofolate cyclohydrolase
MGERNFRDHRPATPLGVVELLRRHAGDLSGKRVVVIGRSRIVGRPPLRAPLGGVATEMNATVTLCQLGHDGSAVDHARGGDPRRRDRRGASANPRGAGAPGRHRGGTWASTRSRTRPRAVRATQATSIRNRSRWWPRPSRPFREVSGPLTVAMLLRNLADAAEAQAAR